MKGITKRKTLIASAILIVLALIITACSFNFITASAEEAEETDEIPIIFDENYFSRANTYNAKITEKDVPREATGKYNSVSYDFSKKNGNIVSDDAPQVTFLTHGLGGNAANWSSDSENDNWEFAYSEGSIFELLQQKADCNLYLARFKNQNKFHLYKLNKRNYNVIDESTEVKKMTDNSKHSVVVFQGSPTDQSNDYIYSQFNMMASRVLLELQELDLKHELPRVNLVGYSRGGLTNLQYALDHPDLVDSIFSLDTPYVGSTSASIDKHILRMFGKGMNDTAGEDDIVNPEVYLGYLNRWNKGYNELYSNIKVHALGAYQSLDMLIYQLIYKTVENGDESILEDFKSHLNLMTVYVSMQLKIIEELSIQKYVRKLMDKILRFIPQYQYDNTFGNGLKAIFDLLFDETEFNILTFTYDIYNDGLVDLPSQLGKDGQSYNAYKGFKNYVKRFGIFGDYNLKKSSIGDLRVTHNIVARDTELLSYIVKNIEMSCNKNGSPFLVIPSETDTNADGVSIVGYIGENVNGTLTIPKEIYYEGGKTENYNKEVVAISDYAFANDMNGELGIRQVIMPDSVETIGRGAFYNNKNIESVILGNGVKEILAGSFSVMPKLNGLHLPSSIEQIEDRAFEQSNITTVTSETAKYTWENNLLINRNVTDPSNAIAIYANPNVPGITVPDGVKTIAPYLFQGNKTLQEIDLNGAKYIGESAFAYTNLSHISRADFVVDAGIDGFIDTPWLKKQTGEAVKIGRVLLSYKGSSIQALEEAFGDVVRIGEYAFVSDSLTNVVLPVSVESIGQNAFTNCANLQWILLNSTNPPVLDGDCFEPNVQLYVKQTSLNAYKGNLFFQELQNRLNAKNVYIQYYGINGMLLGSGTEQYYSTFDQALVPPEVEGHKFTYWTDNVGTRVYPTDIFPFYNDLDLNANYKIDEYSITFESEKGSEKKSIQYGDNVTVATPNKQGYTFLGWYDSKTAGNCIVDANGTCVWQKMSGVKALYARFSPNEYTITYSTAMGNFVGAKPLTFTAENPITPNEIAQIVEFGYVFSGWSIAGNAFTTTYGIFNNITLTANWLGTNTAVNYATNTTLNHEYSVVTMLNAPQAATYKFYIASNVRAITFIGSTGNTFVNMQIMVNSRTTALVMGFSNMNFQPAKSALGEGYNAIYAPTGCKLYVSYKGTNKIVGGLGADGSNGFTGETRINGYNGGCAISAYSVTLMAFDVGSKIHLVGGAGGNGGNGFDGAKGSDGTKAPSGSIFKPIKGENGANGQDGNTGGNGGTGGFALYASANNIYLTQFSAYSVNGGAGGNGGNGGTGGAGGNGASDTSANIITGVGDPGDGGGGGKGGANGLAGQGSLGANCQKLTTQSGEKGTDGQSGLGGAPGLGGKNGVVGNDGGNGTPGKAGLEGNRLNTVAKGTLAAGQQQQAGALIDLPYAFSTEFLNLYL